jgi:hypothetical protein
MISGGRKYDIAIFGNSLFAIALSRLVALNNIRVALAVEDKFPLSSQPEHVILKESFLDLIKISTLSLLKYGGNHLLALKEKNTYTVNFHRLYLEELYAATQEGVAILLGKENLPANWGVTIQVKGDVKKKVAVLQKGSTFILNDVALLYLYDEAFRALKDVLKRTEFEGNILPFGKRYWPSGMHAVDKEVYLAKLREYVT